MNQAGQVVGFSSRFSGESDMGNTAWLYSDGTTQIIGLYGVEHTRGDGYTFNSPQTLTEAGHVVGYAQRYDGMTDLGASARVFNGETTMEIGLTDAEHTGPDGYREPYIYDINPAGHVAGQSMRFVGGAEAGASAWVYNGTTTVLIGLTDAEHTRSDGHRYSGIDLFNHAGHVAGYAERFDGDQGMGDSAWLYNGTTTLNIGMTDAEHTRADGYRVSSVSQLNEAGQVAGSSYRFNGDEHNGISAWLYDGSTTFTIGLTDAENTGPNGFRVSQIEYLNQAGQVVGYSERYAGNEFRGNDAWVYDPTLGTVKLQLSVSDDGWAFSDPSFLGDDGVVLGTYQLYDGVDSLGERAFYWSPTDGLWDLGQLLGEGQADYDWTAIYTAIQVNGLGYIIGEGAADGLPEGSRSAYIARVPEPSVGALLLPLATLLTRRRRAS